MRRGGWLRKAKPRFNRCCRIRVSRRTQTPMRRQPISRRAKHGRCLSSLKGSLSGSELCSARIKPPAWRGSQHAAHPPRHPRRRVRRGCPTPVPQEATPRLPRPPAISGDQLPQAVLCPARQLCRYTHLKPCAQCRLPSRAFPPGEPRRHRCPSALVADSRGIYLEQPVQILF